MAKRVVLLSWIVLVACRRPGPSAPEAPPRGIASAAVTDAAVDAGASAPGLQPDCTEQGVHYAHGERIAGVDACHTCECVAGTVRCPVLVACDPIIVERVRFAAGSARVPAEAAALLDAVAEVLAARPELGLALIGHADATEADAVALSRRRADAVRDALIARGVAAAQLVRSDGVGATRPLGGDPANDRRVDFEPIASTD